MEQSRDAYPCVCMRHGFYMSASYMLAREQKSECTDYAPRTCCSCACLSLVDGPSHQCLGRCLAYGEIISESCIDKPHTCEGYVFGGLENDD